MTTITDQFIDAAGRGDIKAMEVMFAQNPIMPMLIAGLQRAAESGQEAVIIHLLSTVPPNMYQGNIDDAFIAAASSGHVGIMAILQPHLCMEYTPYDATDAAIEMGHIHVIQFMKLHDQYWLPGEVLARSAKHVRREIASLAIQWGETYADAFQEARSYDSNYELMMILTLQKWGGVPSRRAQYITLVEYTLALRPLELPLYVELWLLEWAAPGPLKEHERVQLLERVNRCN
jgi:hypothetical protein